MSKTPPRAKVTSQALDLSVLEKMVEPFNVQIHRIKNGQRSSIPLPIGESGEAGVGWSKGEVRAIDQGWLVEFAGGGMYEVTVTDSTVPDPQKLTWTNFWPVPEKIPPTLVEASGLPPVPSMPIPSVAAPAAIPSETPTPQVTMPQFPNGLPAGGFYYPQPMQYPVVQPAAQPAASSVAQQQAYYAQMAQAAAVDANQRRLEERLAQTEAQLRQAQLESAQRQHQAELERVRAEHQQSLQRLEARIAEMSSTTAKSSSSSEVEQLRIQMENERREREAERREAMMREQMLMLKQSIDSQIAQMQQNMQQMMQAMQQNKSDPMMQLMMEQNRQQMEAMKEISRQSNDAIRNMQAFMMNPRDVMQMTKEASNGLDGVTNKMSSIFGTALEMQQKVLENALQLNQGGNETIGLIRDGIGSAQSMIERYVTVKGREAQVVQQAQATAAQAQAQAAAIQAQAQAAIAQAQARAAQPQPAQPIAAVRAQPGLAGAQSQPNGAKAPQSSSDALAEWRRQQEMQAQAATTQANPPPRETANVVPQPVPTTAPKRHGRTDEEWFGPAMPDVINTRAAVKKLFDDMARGGVDKDAATPEVVAKGTVQAVAFVQANNVMIPALVELLMQGEVDKFIEVLLPDEVFAPQKPDQYRKDTADLLAKMLGMEDDDEDENEEPDNVIDIHDPADDDGVHSDDVKDGSVERPRPRARA